MIASTPTKRTLLIHHSGASPSKAPKNGLLYNRLFPRLTHVQSGKKVYCTAGRFYGFLGARLLLCGNKKKLSIAGHRVDKEQTHLLDDITGARGHYSHDDNDDNDEDDANYEDE